MADVGGLLVNATPVDGFLPGQMEAHRLAEDLDGPEWVLLSGGMGAGKTYWLCWEAVRLHFLNLQAVLTDGGAADEVWGIGLSATHNLLRKTVLVTLQVVLAEAGLKPGRDYKVNRQEGILRFRFGGGMYLFTAERPELVIGVNASYGFVDEPGTPKNAEALMRLRARLRGRGPFRKIIMAGTPEDILSRAWFYDFIASPDAQMEFGAEGRNSRRIVFADTRDNRFLENLENYVEGMEEVFTREQQDAYIGGRFVAFNLGRVYSAFIDRSVEHGGHTAPEGHELLNPPSRGNPLFLMMDFNLDPMCGLVGFAMGEDGMRIVDEIRIPKEGAEAGETPIGRWCDEAASRWVEKWHGPVCIYGDATERKQTASASKTGWAIVHDRLRPAVQSRGLDYRTGVWRSNPPEKDRVNTVNAAFEHGRLVVAHACVWLRKDLNLVGWKEGTSQIDKTDPALTHLSDALGYGVVQRSGYAVTREAVKPSKVVAVSDAALAARYDWGT